MGMTICQKLQESPAPAAVALGCFDGLHMGHQRVISGAINADGLLPTVFTFDASPQADICGKGAPQLMTNGRKLAFLERMGVEQVYMLPFAEIRQMTAEDFVSRTLCGLLHAKKVCCGFNFHFGHGGKAGSETLKELCGRQGISVEIVPEVRLNGKSVSSTAIRACLERGDVEEANAMLGRCFGFDFAVVHGRRLGRELGTPTINQPLPPGFIRPKFGVYASVVQIDGNDYCGVTNIGVKPTVGSDYALAETWIPDYDGDLYGRPIPVELLKFIRPEQKFSGIRELKQAILRDGETARKILQELYLQKNFPVL